VLVWTSGGLSEEQVVWVGSNGLVGGIAHTQQQWQTPTYSDQ